MKIFRYIIITIWCINVMALALCLFAASQLPDYAYITDGDGTIPFWDPFWLWSAAYLLFAVPVSCIATLVYSIKSKIKWLTWLMIISTTSFFTWLGYRVYITNYAHTSEHEDYADYEIDDVDSEPWHMMMGDFDKRQCQTFNDLIAAEEDYDTFVKVLKDYYYASSNPNNTPYQDYCSYVQLFDSLTSFDDSGQTIVIYMHLDLNGLFDRIATKHFITELKNSNAYTDAMDAAWKNYLTTMATVCDSVSMCRPAGQGSISYIEHVTFMQHNRIQHLKYLESLYFANDPAYKPEIHREITTKELSDAFDAVYKHQKIYKITDPEFQDDVDYDVPIPERHKALETDRKCYFELERALISAGVDKNVLNNLRRDKMIQLKNMYRTYRICEMSFHNVILNFDCTDDELRSYDFDESYKAVYGYYPKD